MLNVSSSCLIFWFGDWIAGPVICAELQFIFNLHSKLITKDAVFQSDVGPYASDIFASKERGIEEKGMASRGGNRRLEINLLSATHLLNISALWAHMNTCFVGRGCVWEQNLCYCVSNAYTKTCQSYLSFTYRNWLESGIMAFSFSFSFQDSPMHKALFWVAMAVLQLDEVNLYSAGTALLEQNLHTLDSLRVFNDKVSKPSFSNQLWLIDN